MSTPHNNANPGDIAKTVLMPGDPLRAAYIAENYLSNVTCYNKVRNMYGFTGEYKGCRISIQGSGMGMPSMGIYSYELFDYYGVENIIRIGSAGAISDDVNLYDLVIAQGTCTNSNYVSQYGLDGTFAPIASHELVTALADEVEEYGLECKIGNVLSSDVFYQDPEALKKWGKMGVLAVEMEAAALYMNAARFGKKAVCITTISDCPLKGTSVSAEKRERCLTDMIDIAMITAAKID